MQLGTQFEQLGIFPLPERDPRPHNARAFLERAQWHATRQPNWATEIKRAGLPVHMGTAQSAVERADFYDEYGPGESKGELDEAVIHPVVPHQIAPNPVDDTDANLAEEEMIAGEITPANQPMWAGESLAYRNEAEDPGSTSYVSPPGGFSTLNEFADIPKPFGRREEFIQAGTVQRPGYDLWTSDKFTPTHTQLNLLEEDEEDDDLW